MIHVLWNTLSECRTPAFQNQNAEYRRCLTFESLSKVLAFFSAYRISPHEMVFKQRHTLTHSLYLGTYLWHKINT